MTDNIRSEQIRSDTLATMEIASEMVQVLFTSLQSTIAQQDEEIARLNRAVAELEARLESTEPASIGDPPLGLTPFEAVGLADDHICHAR